MEYRPDELEAEESIDKSINDTIYDKNMNINKELSNMENLVDDFGENTTFIGDMPTYNKNILTYIRIKDDSNCHYDNQDNSHFGNKRFKNNFQLENDCNKKKNLNDFDKIKSNNFGNMENTDNLKAKIDEKYIYNLKNNSIKFQNKTFYVDGVVVGPEQEKIFEPIKKNIIEKAINGYNCAIFAYGQTGSGKTYTIQGTFSRPGIILRTLEFLHGIYKSIKFSFIEIYNENLIDLLNPSTDILIREDPIDGVVLHNSTVVESSTAEKSISLYRIGVGNRKTANTEMNANSSRSHSIFTIFIDSKDHGITRKSKLCIVDLAGSEKYKEGKTERIKETCNINKSLLCLGKIVNKLSSKDCGYISYRDSKLTFILKDALGGNSKLAIIGNVCLINTANTLNTLFFLQRSKLIKNNPSINYDPSLSSISRLIEDLKILDEENTKLKQEIASFRNESKNTVKGSVISVIKETHKNILYIKEKIKEMKQNLTDFTFEAINENKKILLEINKNLKIKNQAEKSEIRKIGK